MARHPYGQWCDMSDPSPNAPRAAQARGASVEDDLEEAFERLVHEGEQRLGRDWIGLFSTGTVAGLEVGLGILAMLIVDARTHDKLLGGIAFSFGFLALLLAHSELFTEGFLIPIITVTARRATVWEVVRFWAATLVTNLFGGWVIMWLVITAFPHLGATAEQLSGPMIHAGFGMHSFALAVLAGAAITLMTRMQHGTDAIGAKIIAAVAVAFLLSGLPLYHSILDSLIMFAALNSNHASFTYGTWARWCAWALLGNLIGGIGLVTLLRLVRVRELVALERQRGEGPRNNAARNL